MAQDIQPFTISSPGFLGLNQQDSPSELNPGFALLAQNCVIDKSGRIASRKGWTKVNTSLNANLSTSDVTCIGELVQNDGTTTILATGGGFLFKLSSTTLTTLTYGGGGAAPTIAANNWKFTSLNGIGLFFQRGYDPLIYDPAVSTTTFRRLSEHSTYSGSVPQANAAISAYGRIWCADTSTDKNTVTWSDIITPQVWTSGTSGSLNLLGVWPKGGDEIVAIAAHNNLLVIFGKRQTLVYSGADNPSTMTLSDTLNEIGCIARDSVANTGDDIIFLSNAGVRSLMRTIQEKSAPLRELSKNVRDEIQSHVSVENMDNVRAVYSPIYSFYLITMPILSEVYCFDLRKILEDGSARVTDWYDIIPKSFLQSSSRVLYIGKAGYIGKYDGYLDDTSTYTMRYLSTWIDFGNPIQKSILKKIIITLNSIVGQVIKFRWGFDFTTRKHEQNATVTSSLQSAEYGIAEYGTDEYGSIININKLSVNGTGSGVVIQVGMDAVVNGSEISIQKVDIFTKNGRL